ncbi:hypothetical protein [Blastopirellula marina]|nr:hypothetical protein [Blastopirellula marina]
MLLNELMESEASDDIWDMCWNHFVLNDTVGEAAYAAVPYLVEFVQRSVTIDWNALALISAIDLARPAGPAMPSRLKQDYFQAIRALPQILANHPQTQWDELTTRYAASCIALGRGQRELAKIYSDLSLEEGIAWRMNRERTS